MLQDLSYAVRTLARSPGFVATTVLTLGLGIGTNTALYQLFAALSPRTLPVTEPDGLVVLDLADRERWRGRRATTYPALTNPLWEEFRNSQEVFSEVVAWANTGLHRACGP